MRDADRDSVLDSLITTSTWFHGEGAQDASKVELRAAVDAMSRAVELCYDSAIANVARSVEEARAAIPSESASAVNAHLKIVESGHAEPEVEVRRSAAALLEILGEADPEGTADARSLFEGALTAERLMLSASHESEEGDVSGVLMNLDELVALLSAGTRVHGAFRFKFCLLGEAGVGKTSLIRRFVHSAFSEEYRQTIGTGIAHREIAVAAAEPAGLARADLSIWDVMGHERLPRLLQAFLLGANGGMVVYSLTDQRSRKELDWWIHTARHVAGDVPLVILANKADEVDRAQAARDTLKVTMDTGIEVVATSARTGLNVEVAFASLVKKSVAAARSDSHG